ncbi:MAG: YjbQ family protein [Bacteroidetes bacterium]|nr:YjbQ family protein [Bacteroidota bacterium]
MVEQTEIILPAFRRGFHLITHIIEDNLPDLPEKGLVHLFIKHTSAGITINENADPTIRMDLENIFNKLIPDGLKEYIHTIEGPDDMPAHIKTTLTGHSVTVPVTNHRLGLGTWQGIYLCEFRNRGGERKLTATIYF